MGHYETYYHFANTTASAIDVTLKLASPPGAVIATYTITIPHDPSTPGLRRQALEP